MEKRFVAFSVLGAIPGPGLLFGLMLAAAIVGGYAARLVRVPRVVGFLLAGLALRTGLDAFVSGNDNVAALGSVSAALHPIKDLALGLILFTIGGVFERRKLRAIGARVWRIGLAEIGFVVLFVFIGCAALLLARPSAYGHATNLILALLLGTAAIATAPAATLFVLQEYEAKGPITNTILGLTGLNNIVCIIAFYVLFLTLAFSGAIQTTGTLAAHVWLALALTSVGSVALGVVAGTILSIIHAKLPIAETLLFFFALFIVLGAAEPWLWEHVGLSYNFLLTALATGAVFANVAIDSQKLEATLRMVGTPIFAGFFVMAGYGLHLADLRHMGWLGGVYVLCRFLGKTIGCRLGVRWAHGPDRADGRLGPALLCQAAVVIGLASFVERYWQSELASQFATVIVGSVVVFEFAGPLLLKRCVLQAGEVKAITLLRRDPVTTEGASLVRLTLQSLFRLFGIHGRAAEKDPKGIRVKHIMRTNVQFILASTPFDEVLHAIERSTYSHFPVVDEDGTFAGVIHFSDVRDVLYDPVLTGLITAVDLADSDSVTVSSDMTATELLEVFTSENVGVLPVVDQAAGRRIVGIVEQRDLLRALHRPFDGR
jgi:Kef-type K+ transport system membrane component KefB/CBS domain-containing protein